MAIFVCPNCAHVQEAPDEYIGRTAKCLKCEAKGQITKDKTPSEKPPSIKAAAPVASSSVPSSKPADPSRLNASISWYQGASFIALLSGIFAVQLFGLVPRQRWEYLIVSPSDTSFETTMDKYGEAGWELVSARRATDSAGSSCYEVILKRPR